MHFRTRVIYTGKVQGVGFRYTARTLATGYPITGWVRNDPDGSVHLEVQGMPDSVRAYLDELAQKMRLCIQNAEEQSIPSITDEEGFSVKH